MRRTYRQDPETGEFVEVTRRRSSSTAPAILPDIAPTQSPIDGREISGRAALRAHNAEHGVQLHGEYGENNGQAYFERMHRERSARLTGQTERDRRERIEAIIPIVEKHER